MFSTLVSDAYLQYARRARRGGTHAGAVASDVGAGCAGRPIVIEDDLRRASVNLVRALLSSFFEPLSIPRIN